MKITELAAWWGAIIATLVLLWDMYKWERSGPIINVSASFHYKSLFRKIRGKKDKSFIVLPPALLPPPLPYVIEPGERWLGGIEQTSKLEEMSRNGYLYCGIYHSCGKKPILQRVIIHKNPESVLKT